MQLRFEWDERKAAVNLIKHKVSFEEVQAVFYDPLVYIFDDEWHSTDEPREIIIGHSKLQSSFTGVFRGAGFRLNSNYQCASCD